jgi:hypothetical protein
VPGSTPALPPTTRLPDGTTVRPTLPTGSSTIPGTTTAPVTPPPAPATPPPAVAPPAAPGTPPDPDAAPPNGTATAPAQPAVPPPTAPPAGQTAPPAPGAGSVVQVVLTTPGTEFRIGEGPKIVPISVNGASRLSVVSLSLTFNPAVLRVRAVQEGSFLRQGGVSVTFAQQVDSAVGRVDISMTRTSDTVGASGSGLLASVLFEPVAAGSSPLTLSGVATNPQGGPVPMSFAPVTVVVK